MRRRLFGSRRGRGRMLPVMLGGRPSVAGPPPPSPGDALLLETGDFLLLETGDKLLLEA